MKWNPLHKKRGLYLLKYTLGRKNFLAIDLALENISSRCYGLWVLKSTVWPLDGHIYVLLFSKERDIWPILEYSWQGAAESSP